MSSQNSPGTMYLTTASAVAIWHNELTGQMSDGMWENSSPRDHWKFWCHLDVQLGSEAKLELKRFTEREPCLKNTYNFAGLYKYVGDRMLTTGRMAKAGADIEDRNVFHAAGYMPKTLEKFLEAKNSGTWEFEFLKEYMDSVSPELAEKYYKTSYTMKELRSDIKLIKSLVKQAAKERF